MLAILLLFTFLTVTGAAFLLLTPPGDPAALARVSALRQRDLRQAVEDEAMQMPFKQRIIDPAVRKLVTEVKRRLPRDLRERVRQRLAAAGVEGEPDQFLGKQVLYSVASAGAAGALMFPYLARGQNLQYFALVVVGAILGWRLPEFSLSRLITQRKKAMERALPEVLDVLCVSVEAGLGFDGAVQKVAERFPDPVAGEFRLYLKEIRLGSSRADALRRLAARSGLTDFQTFAAAVIQADQLGVSIAKVLRTQAEAMRIKRKQRAEEKAMQLPLKILFPLIMFIFPTLFIVILGPVAINFLTQMTLQ